MRCELQGFRKAVPSAAWRAGQDGASLQAVQPGACAVICAGAAGPTAGVAVGLERSKRTRSYEGGGTDWTRS